MATVAAMASSLSSLSLSLSRSSKLGGVAGSRDLSSSCPSRPSSFPLALPRCSSAPHDQQTSSSQKKPTEVDSLPLPPQPSPSPSPSADLDKEIQKAVRKTAATFAPRASTASKNPAVPGSTLYTVFEVQAYISMLLGGMLSFNLLFPSNEPDIWRLMGMWSVWMFTIPSLRARDCSSKEKDALNYLFLAIPLINVVLPIFWKSFPAIWSADVAAFFAMYTWKLDWLSLNEKKDT